MRLEQRVAIVTGSGSGMGEAIARLFVNEGAKVAVVDRDGGAAHSVAESIGDRAVALATDVTDEQAVAEMVRRTADAFGYADILVNCVGLADFAKAEETTSERWLRVINVNLTGTFLCCREVGREMIARGGGSIVNISSTAGLAATPYMAGYTAAKHAIVGLTKELAIEWGKHNVRVNCICPGATETPMLLGSTTETYRVERRRRIPLGRLAQPSDQASAALFLASSESAYVTGAVIPVDGGVSALTPGASESALAGI